MTETRLATSLLTPEQHRAVAARLRQADPRASGEDHLAQLRFARLHELIANAIEVRDRKEPGDPKQASLD
jgi:hypothetical protein